jgi:hypothetical protein
MGSSAASSSAAAATSNLFFGIQISEKLTKTNHVLWQAQVLTAICGARVEGHITGKIVAPNIEIDVKKGDTCRMDLPGPTPSVGTRADYSVGPCDYSTCVARHLLA